MTSPQIQRALISVYDKTGIVELAKGLCALGIELIASGGTAEELTAHGISIRTVEEFSGSAELLGGRVKTLHPHIHAALLADRDDPRHMQDLKDRGIETIDLVVVNLYPFELATRSDRPQREVEEMIDIGGPCLLRAAGKNHRHVLTISEPRHYPAALRWLQDARSARAPLGSPPWHTDGAPFMTTAAYDAAIARWFGADVELREQGEHSLHLRRLHALRYGENPHQAAEVVYAMDAPRTGLLQDGAVLQGGLAMSFNNYLDASSALDLTAEFTRARDVLGGCACVLIKHTNPCGCAVASDPIEAYRRAYVGDPQAAMGGTLAVNLPVDAAFADAVMNSLARWGKDCGATAFFVEVWVAPSFDAEAVRLIRTAKPWGERVRLVAVGDTSRQVADRQVKYVQGGLLIQDHDMLGLDEEGWTVCSKRAPTQSELRDLRVAWLVCKHTSSNAVSICGDGMLLGNGAGQMSRSMSCRLATWLAADNGHRLDGAVAASDAFFPFADGPQVLIRSGVRAIIQPGGSKRDMETVSLCDEHDVALVCTGTRHLKH